MSKRDVIGCSFGAVLCLGIILELVFGGCLLFGVPPKDIGDPIIVTGIIFCAIGGIGVFFSDPLITGGSL
ncbi:hypothetical protein [Bradyrhizobium elkanii]|uniref:hypothetical protein n=1 Tax=Bradyrhizobium elkanii TaxID=29448 RepID=UPI002226E592|nr:hypothetical protein [Bradyrhizobium elkanii]MCW2114433.1 hypothetical protein [Bradyrhizobium elkanii]